MTLIDGTSGSVAAGVWSRRGTFRACPAPASTATGAPSHVLVAAAPSIVRIAFGGTTVAIAGVIEGRCQRNCVALSDLSPSSNLTGQRSYTDERLRTGGIPVGATSRSGERRTGQQGAKISERLVHNLGNPCAEKVWPHRPRQNKGAATLTKAPSAFRRIGGAVRQGTLTITGSNVRLGTEMPVALSSFCIPTLTRSQRSNTDALVRKTGGYFLQ